MRLQAATPGDRVVDTDAILTATNCAQLVSLGFKGVWRYLSDLTPKEMSIILASGLTLYFVNHSRDVGWIPSAAEGMLDGNRDIADLKRLGIPGGVHVAFDLEGVGGGNPQNVIAHVNAHAAVIQGNHYLAALYAGAGALLTSAQLYALRSTLYWHSVSLVRDIAGNEAGPECGWAAYQLFPDDVTLPGGLRVDLDAMAMDFKKRVFIGVAA